MLREMALTFSILHLLVGFILNTRCCINKMQSKLPFELILAIVTWDLAFWALVAFLHLADKK